MIDELKHTIFLEDVTDEQMMRRYKCPKCGWVGSIKQMDRDTDCGDEYDAVWSDFCCPNQGCWQWYSYLEEWKEVI